MNTTIDTITGLDVQLMVQHQLQTPLNGYLGSGYGSDTKALLMRPQNDGSADEYLAKLRKDVPVLQALPAGSTNLYGVQTAPDRLDLMIEVAGTMFTLPTPK
ncbi:MAG: hypothetical protein WC856_02245 [Methylococcaceae bacterium]|jgi:hypothetical protein